MSTKRKLILCAFLISVSGSLKGSVDADHDSISMRASHQFAREMMKYDEDMIKLTEEGEYDKASDLYDKRVVPGKYNEALKERDNGNLDQAFDLFQHCIHTPEFSSRAFHNMGMIAHVREDYDNAFFYFVAATLPASLRNAQKIADHLKGRKDKPLWVDPSFHKPRFSGCFEKGFEDEYRESSTYDLKDPITGEYYRDMDQEKISTLKKESNAIDKKTGLPMELVDHRYGERFWNIHHFQQLLRPSFLMGPNPFLHYENELQYITKPVVAYRGAHLIYVVVFGNGSVCCCDARTINPFPHPKYQLKTLEEIESLLSEIGPWEKYVYPKEEHHSK